MKTLNNTTITGQILRALEFRPLPGGGRVASFTLASGYRYLDRQGQYHKEITYVPCVLFGRDVIQVENLLPGSMVTVCGRLRTDTWERGGQRRSKLVLIGKTVKPEPASAAEDHEPCARHAATSESLALS